MNYLFSKNSWLSQAKNIGLTYKTIFTVLALSFISTITEIFGIGIFLPIFQFIRLEGNLDALAADSLFWIYIIDIFLYFGLEVSLSLLLLISFSFFLSRQLFVYIRILHLQNVIQRIVQSQRNHLFDSYIDANTSYHDSIPIGNLVNIIMTEVRSAVLGVMSPIDLIVYSIMFVGYLSMLFLLSLEMTIASLIILILASLLPKRWIKQTKEVGKSLVLANTQMSEFLVGRLRSPRLVRLACTEDAEKNEFHSLTYSQRKYQIVRSKLSAKTTVAMDPVIIGLSLLFLYFSYTVLNLQIETIGLYLVIILRLMPVTQSIIGQLQTIQGAKGAIDILENRFISMKKSVERDTGTKNLVGLSESITFDNISYSYADGLDDALKDIYIEFQANKMTAVVGPSGSGKSTLIDLLPQLRVPSRGVIMFDSISACEYTLKSVRNMISYVPQSPQIFNGTVRDHILYGKSNATNDELLRAAKLSGAYSFISKLPQGFDTNLGEAAVKLSGGQRQRLDLARALIKKTPVLILDEPTSNLDAESEEKFLQVLKKIRKETETTIIIVTHRLESIVDADRIVVLNNGRVEGFGNHSELQSQDGWYSKAWLMQN